MLFRREDINNLKLISIAILYGLAILLCLSGCGSDEATQQPSPKSGQSSPPKQSQTTQPQLTGLTSEALHETGIETYRLGLSSEDPSTIAQGISILEEALFADPENATLWLDLADAYINSDLYIEYPYAIDIYWMLLDEDEIPKDYLYTRLAEAYAKMGNSQAAFDVATERVKNAQGDNINYSALHLAFLALANDSFSEAAESLKSKANSHAEPAYLLLLASNLQEAAGNKQAAIELIDQALPLLGGNGSAAAMARRERGRLAQ